MGSEQLTPVLSLKAQAVPLSRGAGTSMNAVNRINSAANIKPSGTYYKTIGPNGVPSNNVLMTSDAYNGNNPAPTLGDTQGLVGASTDTNNTMTTPGSLGSTLAGIGQIAQSIGGIWNAYNGWKNYKLAKEQMRFQQGLARANFANQAKQYNNMVTSSANTAKSLAGYGKTGYENYGALTSQEAANYDKKVNESKVSETF